MSIHEIKEYIYYENNPTSTISKTSSSYSLSMNDSCSVFSFIVSVDSDYQEIWIGGEDTFIMDMETGTRYAARYALNDARLYCTNAIIKQKGKRLLFQIVFPRLPKNVNRICIYGIPSIGLMGGNCFEIDEIKRISFFDPDDYPEFFFSPLKQYEDEIPIFKHPLLVLNSTSYNTNDIQTDPIFINAPRIYPIEPEIIKRNRFAFWCTKDTTYVTQIFECKKTDNPYRISSNASLVIIEDSVVECCNTYPLELRIISAESFPLDKTFIIRGIPGDFVIIVMKFPPLPLKTNNVIVDMDNRSYPTDWLLPEEEEVFYDQWYIGYLRNNQQYVRLYPDNGGKIIR